LLVARRESLPCLITLDPRIDEIVMEHALVEIATAQRALLDEARFLCGAL